MYWKYQEKGNKKEWSQGGAEYYRIADSGKIDKQQKENIRLEENLSQRNVFLKWTASH